MTSYNYKINLDNLNLTQSFSISGPGNAGYAVSSGDVNGDNISDAIIGAPSISTIYIIYGNLTSFILDINLTIIAGKGIAINRDNTGNHPGVIVASADTNGDCNSDIIISAPQCFPGVSCPVGKSYDVFCNNNLSDLALTNLTLAQGISIIGPSASSMSGIAISRAGDINEDGYPDLLIGVVEADHG